MTNEQDPGQGWANGKLRRRLVTIPGVFLLTLLDLLALPLLLPISAAMDFTRGNRWHLFRFHVAVAYTLSVHCAGLLALLFVWFASPSRERRLRWDQALMYWWNIRLWRGAEVLFGMRISIDGRDCLREGPILFFSRHASLLDTLLPMVLLDPRAPIHWRYVMKRELLMDPCLDVVGHRVPTAFVWRGTREHGREIAAVQSLLENLGPQDGIVLFPEGTRFSESKRNRIMTRYAESRPDVAARAANLQVTLPPHPGGPLGLIDNSDADVVFCAHTGLEPAHHLESLINGSLLDAQVFVKLWRVPRSEIPADYEQRKKWLDNWWQRIDRWISERQASASAPEQRRSA